eukprot:351323-Chlamydomonas_euryale.AAC.3
MRAVRSNAAAACQRSDRGEAIELATADASASTPRCRTAVLPAPTPPVCARACIAARSSGGTGGEGGNGLHGWSGL